MAGSGDSSLHELLNDYFESSHKIQKPIQQHWCDHILNQDAHEMKDSSDLVKAKNETHNMAHKQIFFFGADKWSDNHFVYQSVKPNYNETSEDFMVLDTTNPPPNEFVAVEDYTDAGNRTGLHVENSA